MNIQNRKLASIIKAQEIYDGAGVKLKRSLGTNQHAHVYDPFLLFDEFISDDASEYIGGFPDHPHRGFETVTYMLNGAMLHRDHLGNEGHLRAGSVQWMTAAHGIIHSEMPEQENGLLHGFQLWLNLTAKDKMKPPTYQEFSGAQIPEITLANCGFIKIIAGNYLDDEHTIYGPVKSVATQPLYFDIRLARHSQLSIPVSSELTALIYVFEGELFVDQAKDVLTAGQLGRLTDGNVVNVFTQDNVARWLFMAATPLKEPIARSGPFVMNTKEEIEQAYRDYRDGVLTQLEQ